MKLVFALVVVMLSVAPVSAGWFQDSCEADFPCEPCVPSPIDPIEPNPCTEVPECKPTGWWGSTCPDVIPCEDCLPVVVCPTAPVDDGTPLPRYFPYGDGTALDRMNNLVWQLSDNDGMTQEEAIAFCEASTLGGLNWHLPSLGELAGIVEAKYKPAYIDPVFSEAVGTSYWSNTMVAKKVKGKYVSWKVSFIIGNQSTLDRTFPLRSRCVSADMIP